MGSSTRSFAETESAALVLATMMRRAGDEYCAEAAVTVCNGTGAIIAAWRGGTYGWTPVPLARPASSGSGLQPLVPRTAGTPAKRAAAQVGPLRAAADGAGGVVAGVDGASVVRVDLGHRLLGRLDRVARASRSRAQRCGCSMR